MARSFNGTTDVITCANGTVLNNVKPVTLCAWVFANTLGEASVGRIFDKAATDSPANAWHFRMQATATVRYEYSCATANLIKQPVNNSVSLGAWHHIAFTWDGSTTAANAHIYVDGVEPSYATSQNASGAFDSDANALLIGNSLAGTATFDGRIAEPQMFNVQLTVNEVNMVRRGLCPRPSTRIGYWPLYGEQTNDMDWSGNNNHGTVTGAVRIDHPPGIGFWMPTKRALRVPASAGGGATQLVQSNTAYFVNRTLVESY